MLKRIWAKAAVPIIVIVGLITVYYAALLFDALPQYVRFFLTDGKDATVAAPDAFYFALSTSDAPGELYEFYSDDYDPDYPDDGYEIETDTHHVFVDKKYLNNDDATLYVSGSYRNYPFKPTVKVDGRQIEAVSFSNTGYADGIFSKTYVARLYHFYINDRILEGHTYEMYVRCDNITDVVKVMFHSDATNFEE